MNWDSFIKNLHWRMHNDFDNVLAIDGYEGSGKSTLGLTIALALDPAFDVERVIYDFEDWRRVYKEGKKKQVYVLDEGGNLGFSRDWNRRENKDLMKILMTSRQNNNTLILCIPNFHWLDTYLRNHRTLYRLHVSKRGFADIQYRKENWMAGTVWWDYPKAGFSFHDLRKTHPEFWSRYEKRKWDANIAQNGSVRAAALARFKVT